ncbi:MAG: glycerol-3-phosphate acyltransferase, partial [Acidobacteria bacterium]|nr:glycerol-3-phosphate acyltransferase [Acidobacteriota bacterium]MDW7985394.1 glycerol-3-phosphate acyltransferase [Acidobacteriota bacterium]
MLQWVLLLGLSFLVGSIPWGWLVTRRWGIDIRQVGSGNIGATNVVRALGIRWGLLVLALDMLKGFLPVLAVRLLAPDRPTWSGWTAA